MPDSATDVPLWIKFETVPPLHAVAQAMAFGETWLFAWTMQSTTAWHWLSRESGLSEARLEAIDQGEPVTMQEVAALARGWRVKFADVLRSLPAGRVVDEICFVPES